MRHGSPDSWERYLRLVKSDPGIAALYPLDEAGGTLARDEVGGAHMTLSGGFTYRQRPLAPGLPPSILGNGSTGKGLVSSAPAITRLTTGSIELWVDRNGDGDAELFEYAIGGSVNTAWRVIFEGAGALQAKVKPSGSQVTLNDGAPAAGAHHIVTSFDGTNVRLFVDAVLKQGPTACGACTAGAGKIWLLGGGNFSNVYASMFGIYRRVLSPSDIALHYSVGRGS